MSDQDNKEGGGKPTTGMEYDFRHIEKKWQEEWKKNDVYKVPNPASSVDRDSSKPKFYVLDMFPYPSGAGLHVGHPLGYIASDIYARYKKLKGFNVLHPMGFDAFGLPAEQYAIDHGIHPAVSTEENISNFKKQLDNIGFCYDWSREVRTSDPHYYKWTQWIFLQIYDSWFNRKKNKAERIKPLLEIFEQEGNVNHELPNAKYQILNESSNTFSAAQWKSFDEVTRQNILMQYRLAYLDYADVWWCEGLGTVLANDEVVNGVSERGGYPVVKKKMRQWFLRITEYADRLLEGLEQIEFTESLKEQQKNWIGKSFGAEINFNLTPGPSPKERGITDFSQTNFLKEKKTGETSPGYFTNTFKEWKAVIDFAKENRKHSTEAEDKLWQQLRNRKLQGCKFRRQHPIAGYIPDFVCIEKKLVIEVDGGYHDEIEQQKFDDARTIYLQEHGYRLIRFTNEDVLKNISIVLQKLGKVLFQEEGLDKDSPSPLERGSGGEVKVFTTRPDTIFGVDFIVLAPEHELVAQITTPAQKEEVEKYLAYVNSRSERERMAEVKQITGCFTGAFAVNPFDGREIPIWIAEYVLAGYGTGAIMGVPCGDQRDFNFAKHFNIPITNIIGDHFNGQEANPTKDAVLQNSGFLNGLLMKDAIEIVIEKLEDEEIGKRQINYKMRDAGFSRQRYWGEPFPVVYKDGLPSPIDEKELPLQLPHVDSYSAGPEGEGPLANITEWVNLPDGSKRETNTMPGYAGSSWYFLRYMDPHNDKTFCDRKISDYWGQVDLYIGGTEHAVGHLLYSRMWTKILYDLDYIGHDEPYKKLVNQGMIQGSSRFVYRVTVLEDLDDAAKLMGEKINTKEKYFPVFFSNNLYERNIKDRNAPDTSKYLATLKNLIPHFSLFEQGAMVGISKMHVDVNIVDGVELDIEAFRKSKPEYNNAILICEDGSISSLAGRGQEGAYICGVEIEKMSKSKFNTVNPDDLVIKYGADTFRMYEMFLGPVEQSKPWDTKGIEGVHRFLKKFWRLFYDEQKGKVWTDEKATDAELKILHKTIKKIEEDTERFSFNTAVSTFMIAVNELTDIKCYKKEILLPLIILLQPYAPHITEELYHRLASPSGRGLEGASYPKLEEKYLTESSKEYPISVNGKLRTTINISLDAEQPDIEKLVLQNEVVQKWTEGKSPKKIIYVKGKMVNVVT